MNKNIKVGSSIYKVIEDEKEHQNDNRGSTFRELREIRINPSMSPDLKEITLLHEVLHACCDFVGIENEKLTEEEWIVRLAPILHQVLKENKLFKEIKKT